MIACALCARHEPLTPKWLAVTQVGPLHVCGGHVDEAFTMVIEGLASPERLMVAVKTAQDMLANAPAETPEPEPGLLGPDCRDGKHGSCMGHPCECLCHPPQDSTSGGGE